MKKIIAVLLTLGLAIQFSQAQNDFRFGFQVSPSFGWMSTNSPDITGNGTNLGLKLGLIGEKYFRENYAFTFGLGFGFNEGGTLKYNGEGEVWPEVEVPADFRTIITGTNLKNSLQYIEIPVGLKLRTQEFGYFRFFADIPVITLGILTQAKGDISGPYENPPEGLDIRKGINFLTYSWGVGGGTEYTIGDNIALLAGIQFQTSFLDVTKDEGTTFCPTDNFDCALNPPKEDSNGKNNMITLKLGVLF
ncbi:MAG: outer membrane beta-barrel protein [Saprospiraceae bacterium]|nr:outer membrane beta-barrel protein [Saprospiraceae bacterium]